MKTSRAFGSHGGLTVAHTLVRTLWLCFCAAMLAGRVRGDVLTPDTYLTEEDLYAAREQNDLTEEEFAELLELFRNRVTSDTLQHSLAASVAPPKRTASRVRALTYQTTFPLRGQSAAHRLLVLRVPGASHDLRAELHGADHQWQVRRWQFTLRNAQRQALLGSFDARWAGGLLIGPAPYILSAPDRFAETLLYPRRGRLNGARLLWSGAQGEAAFLFSYRQDPELAHLTSGVRYRRNLGRIILEPALLHQRLSSRETGGVFNADFAGLCAELQGNARLNLDLAASKEGTAIQLALSLRGHPTYRVQAEWWMVDTGFRNPLLRARGEPDRESVAYPELDRTFSSPSTGERGCAALLHLGPARAHGEMAFSYWRERPSRSASLKIRLGHSQRYRVGSWRIAYYLHSRPGSERRDYRHEWTGRIKHRRMWIEARFRAVEGKWYPYGPRGGRLRTGWGAGDDHTLCGRVAISATLEDADFAQSGTSYWTLRIDQWLPVESVGQIGFHLRWRSAYRGHAPALTLRLTSGVTL